MLRFDGKETPIPTEVAEWFREWQCAETFLPVSRIVPTFHGHYCALLVSAAAAYEYVHTPQGGIQLLKR
jgi:hypothetical protein